MDAVVIGNVTLDVICSRIEDVPRFESLSFEHVAISPGGCGSNVAIGLHALGVSTGLVCKIGTDISAAMIEQVWKQVGLDLKYVKRTPEKGTAVSIGLVDGHAQPRFIHTPGANAGLTVDDIDIRNYYACGAQFLHIAGYFVLPGLMDGRLLGVLKQARKNGIKTSLDTVNYFRITEPSSLWECMPELDIFLCNQVEGHKLTGEYEPALIAAALRQKGASAVIVKLGAQGCHVNSYEFTGIIPTVETLVVDTTGAGDAFAAGLIAALINKKGIKSACMAGHDAAARVIGTLGAVGGWINCV